MAVPRRPPDPPNPLVDRPPLPEGTPLVLGLARSGRAAMELLASRGRSVLGADSGAPEGVQAPAGGEVRLRTDGVELLDRADWVVKSPGVPVEAPAVGAARERGVPVIGELEAAWRCLPNPVIAVTGTNGKTTTTELIGHVLRTAGRPVAVAGNVGTPLSSLPGTLAPEAVVVCECSSFQLEDTEAFAPECAVLLNVSEDHLDRHGSLEAYLAAKLRIVARQRAGDVVVVNLDDPHLSRSDLGRGTAVGFGTGPAAAVRHTEAGIEAFGGSLIGSADLALIGPHNRENAAAAAAAAISMGVARGPVAAGLADFPGVHHRLERVTEVGGVAYVNDSKATNVASAAVGIRSFEGGVHAILGGAAKGGGFEALCGPVAERCAACYLIGESAPRLAADLEAAGVPLHRSGDLRRAVEAAARGAKPGEVVLLSPACASFDQFRDYEERGERFREIVEGLR